MLATIVWTLLAADPPPAKLPSATAKEMTEAIIAVNKALGLESWIVEGAMPCVDRGGLEATIKDVSAEDTRECAATAFGEQFPGLGKDYVVGIAMAAIGPVTAFAIGIHGADGWGAYSCDPKRRCLPTKLGGSSKQAKRLLQRYHKACADPQTVWFPDREQVCAGIPMAAPTRPPAKSDTIRAAPLIKSTRSGTAPDDGTGPEPYSGAGP